VAEPGWQFWIDRGGTFTDIVGRAPDGSHVIDKRLSETGDDTEDAAIAGIRAILGIHQADPIPHGLIDSVRMGTTVATNALLQRRGARTLLVVNAGFADLLRIGTQARPALFDLNITLHDQLYEHVAEVTCRMAADGTEIAPLDEAQANALFAAARQVGLTACAIALIHAWRSPAHEQRLAELARQAGFEQVSASHAVSPMVGLVARADTTVADAYLSPVLRRHVDRLAAALGPTRLSLMQSHGGLVRADVLAGKDAILSGPAGGIVGAVRTAASAGIGKVIGFDMGGTSTDVALYDGSFDRTLEATVAGIRLRTPMLAINTVAAGGGSVLQFDGLRCRVGPQSAGANPGPACYRRGGPLTVTDANLLLGKLQPRHFPAIFGPGGDQPLDAAVVSAGFTQMAESIAAAGTTRPDIRDLAEGFLAVAVNAMANAIREISIQKGQDPKNFVLHCFGGAGGQHACLVAEEMDMDTVFIHPHAGVLSAYGMGLADQSVVREQALELPLSRETRGIAQRTASRLADAATTILQDQGAIATQPEIHSSVNLRYEGSSVTLPVILAEDHIMRRDFTESHQRRFGFTMPQRQVIAAELVVEATSPGERVSDVPAGTSGGGGATPIDHVELWSGGRAHISPVFDRDDLRAGDTVTGPALIRERAATTVIEPGWLGEITKLKHMILHRAEGAKPRRVRDGEGADPALLELFGNIFINVARQMGVVLQSTARSVNIKERLDFSCAVFDAEGGLIANAPHVPVHLGAMGESVRTILKHRRHTLKPGDVIALNNPFNGGTHLPDITIITPAFSEDGKTILFFVGNRGHHADIGGITPGSTPPGSTKLEQEGVVIDDFLLVDGGEFREQALLHILTSARYPARNPEMNLADIKAQIAANRKGVDALNDVIARYGWTMVRRYMQHLIEHAAETIRRLIDRLSASTFHYIMDSGAELHVALRPDHTKRRMTIDFAGTSAQQADNFNAPPSVTRAVVLYVLRCLAADDIPLNDGCLQPVTLLIPQGSFLAPNPGAAVVAGNTEVSQAVCNALFGAVGTLACSQATMNNFLFGNATTQYYETICGGAGAGADFAGASAVQTHMTNTRITDPEVLEMTYPVRLEEFSIRPSSGGRGRHQGGNGAIRRVRFLEPMQAFIVASRRTFPPFGLAGGSAGEPGSQWIDHPDGTRTDLPGRAEADVDTNDVFVIQTPGGGGFGQHADPTGEYSKPAS